MSKGKDEDIWSRHGKKMMEIITGGSGSGKSAYAEEQADLLGTEGPKYYIATMLPYGEETQKKIKRHRTMREGKGFTTLEWGSHLGQKLGKAPGDLGNATVLLECVSNLVANEMYSDETLKVKTGRQAEELAERIAGEIGMLADSCRHLIVVTNEVFSEMPMDVTSAKWNEETEGFQEMERYKRVLGLVNQKLVSRGDQAKEVVYGIPCSIRRGNTDFREKQPVLENEKEKESDPGKMWMIVGGAFQGKQQFARELCPDLRWTDGAFCDLSEVDTWQGVVHFHLFVRRWMECGKTSEELVRRICLNKEQCVIVTDEIGCGLVPVDPFDRTYREETGRICTRLAAESQRVYRVLYGVGNRVK